MVDILIVRVDDDLWVTDGVLLCLVHPGVQGCHVDVLYFLVLVGYMIQLDGIVRLAKEVIPGLERVDDFQRVEELAEICVGFHLQVSVHSHMMLMSYPRCLRASCLFKVNS